MAFIPTGAPDCLPVSRSDVGLHTLLFALLAITRLTYVPLFCYCLFFIHCSYIRILLLNILLFLVASEPEGGESGKKGRGNRLTTFWAVRKNFSCRKMFGHFEPKTVIWVKFKGKIKILSTQNLLCQKFVAVCRNLVRKKCNFLLRLRLSTRRRLLPVHFAVIKFDSLLYWFMQYILCIIIIK